MLHYAVSTLDTSPAKSYILLSLPLPSLLFLSPRHPLCLLHSRMTLWTSLPLGFLVLAGNLRLLRRNAFTVSTALSTTSVSTVPNRTIGLPTALPALLVLQILPVLPTLPLPLPRSWLTRPLLRRETRNLR